MQQTSDAGLTEFSPASRKPAVPFKAIPRPEDDLSHLLEVKVYIPTAFGPALLSAIEEIQNEVGGRLEGPHDFRKEAALTRASDALAKVRSQLTKLVRHALEVEMKQRPSPTVARQLAAGGMDPDYNL